MYRFVDTTEVSESTFLPSEALMLNGEYIENQIKGYRTLSVSGREALSPEITTYEIGTKDGSAVKGKRYPARTIIVKYQLIAEDAAAFRAAYNQLAGILDVEDAELIFNDETDKFFIGTPSFIGEVEPGRNAVVGEFEILCTDPFKYSVAVYEAETIDYEETDEEGNVISTKMFSFEYNGTYKAFPTLEAQFYKENETSEDGETSTALTGNGDCGFVSFFTEDGKIIQLGNPDEANGEDFPKSQTLIAQEFENSKSWGTAAKALWTASGAGTIGTAKSKSGAKEGEYYLKATKYGSNNGDWHGATITRTLPADATGEVGATDFRFEYRLKMCISNQSELGSFSAFLLDSNDKAIYSVTIYKDTKGKTCTVSMIGYDGKNHIYGYLPVAYKIKHDVDLSKKNVYFGEGMTGQNISSITKNGRRITFNIAGMLFSMSHAAFEGFVVKKVKFTFEQYANKPALAYNGIYGVKFVKHNCDTWRNIPNKFSVNDVITADCRTGEIRYNNTLAPEFGALGNDWEDFCLKKGLNQIGVAYSDWVTAEYAPTFKLRYREVFL